MCNRFVQQGREVRPGQRALVLLRGPGGEFEVPFVEAVFGGPARSESRKYWLAREGAEPVLGIGLNGRYRKKGLRCRFAAPAIVRLVFGTGLLP